MKVGDLVRPVSEALSPTPIVEEGWKGLVTGYEGVDPIIYWNNEFPSEVEWADQLEVIS